jgi:universal stress protein E
MYRTGFRNVLVCLNPDCGNLDPAVQAVRAAADQDARITLTAVVEAPPERPQFLLPPAIREWHEAYVNETKSRLAEAAQKVHEMRENGPSVSSEVLICSDHLEIVRQVIRGGHDALFLAVKSAPDGRIIISPGEFKIVRKTPCPVWFAQSGEPIRRIGVAVAPITALMPEDVANRASEFNRYLTEFTVQLATKCNAEVHVIQAWEMLGESWLTTRTGYDQYHNFVQQLTRALQREFQQLLGEFESAPVKIVPHFEQGYPEDVIPRVFREYDIDLLTIGAVARVGILGHLMGSTAERVLTQISCSAIVLKPEGWVSPIKA